MLLAERKVAVVSGAAGGIGRATALKLAEEGYTVIGTDTNVQGLDRTLRQLLDIGSDNGVISFDVRDEDAWKDCASFCAENFGRVDCLVNNAGISTRDKVEDCTLEFWHEVMDTNVTSMMLSMKHMIPLMIKNGKGSIVNVSSVGALAGIGGGTVYPASKGAVRSLSKRVAANYGAYHIRVNTVFPGWIKTDMVKNARKEKEEFFLQRQPLKYFGRAEDVAEAIVFLAGDKARFITGAEIVVDGGFTAN